ncbi:MAG TPA: 2OG-Fe(II) oxygenase [Gammaproteobacteria bacterium]
MTSDPAGLRAAAEAGDAGARVRLGTDCLVKARFDEAAEWFHLAAAQGSAEAMNSLATLHLNGLGTEQSPRQACTLFTQAAEQGLREAHYNLSSLLYNGLGTSRDETLAQQHLLQAASAGHRPALRALGFLYHLCGSVDDLPLWSSHCFRLAAEAGDPASKHALALRLWHGHGVDADREQARHWLSAAAQDGMWAARVRLAGLQRETSPAPKASTAASRCDGPLPGFSLPAPQPPAARHTWQFLSEHEDALDGYLCDQFINVAAPRLMPSSVVDPKTGGTLQSELRTSHSMHFMPSMYDAVTAQLVRHIAAIAALPPAHAEPLGVLRYGPGQEYRPHYDYYTDDRHQAQRLTTVFVYLDEVEEGGGTDFPRLGVRVDPGRGKAVKFLNCDAAGKPNPETLHAGLPVIRGEKWLATLWFWDRPFHWFS